MKNIEIIVSIIALVVSGVSFAWSFWVHRTALIRERQQATLDAFNTLQIQVLDELIKFKKTEITEIAKHSQSEEYLKLSTLLARCEHFAVGVNAEIYDMKTVSRLAGEHIVRIYKNFLPLIEAKRRYQNNQMRYHEFEKLANNLGYKEKPEVGNG